MFLQVKQVVLNVKPLSLFVNGKAGHKNFFLVNTLCAWVQAIRGITLPTATSASAAQLYPGGCTTHSTSGVST